MATPLSQRELDAAPRGRRPVHRRARRGGLSPFRGAQGDVRPRPDLRAPRGADEARDGAERRRVRERRPQRARALALRLRGLSRQLRQRPRRRGSPRPRRRRSRSATRTSPTASCARASRTRTTARSASGSSARGTRRPRSTTRSTSAEARRRAPGDRTARRADVHRALPRLRVSARRSRRPVPALPRLDGAALGGRRRPLLPQPDRARASARSSAGTSHESGAASTWDAAFPSDRMVPALEATLARPRRRPALAAERRARSRGPPEQDAARVLRADRGPGARRARDQAAGRAGRLAGALPRGRPHRAFRAHLAVAHGRGAAARRQRRHRRLGDAARASDDRSRLARAPARRSRARSSSRPRARRSCSGCCAATARSCSTRSSSTRRPT